MADYKLTDSIMDGANPVVQQDAYNKTADVLNTMNTHGPATAQTVLAAHVPTLAEQLQAEINDPSKNMWHADRFHKLAEIANRGQQMITQPIAALQEGRGGRAAAKAIVDAALNNSPKKSFSNIAEKYAGQNPLINAGLATAGAIGDVFVDPANLVTPELKAEKILSGTIKNAAKSPAIEQKLAGLGEQVFSREIPTAREVIYGSKLAAKDLKPGVTGVIKSSVPEKMTKEMAQKIVEDRNILGRMSDTYAAGKEMVLPQTMTMQQRQAFKDYVQNSFKGRKP